MKTCYSKKELIESYKAGLRDFDIWTESDQINLSNVCIPNSKIYISCAQLNFKNADLKKCNFGESNLDSANLAGANLTDANLEYASLEGLKLKDTILKGTCIDPKAKAPKAIKAALKKAGLKIDKAGKWMYGYWTFESPNCGKNTYKMRKEPYVAPYFSISHKSECHPGIYLAGQEYMEAEYTGFSWVKCRCLFSEIIKVEDKQRCKRLWVLSKPIELEDRNSDTLDFGKI